MSVSGRTTKENVEEETIEEKISVFDERHFGKKGIIIMIDDNGKKISAIFKDKKNADKFNRNNPSDIKKLLQLAKAKKFPQTIDESAINENLSDKIKNLELRQKYTLSSAVNFLGMVPTTLTPKNIHLIKQPVVDKLMKLYNLSLIHI